MSRVITEDEVTKRYNQLSSSARRVLYNLAHEYQENGTYAFKLSDIAETEDMARPVLDHLVDYDFMMKSGSAEDPKYRLTRSLMDSLVYNGILELDSTDPKF